MPKKEETIGAKSPAGSRGYEKNGVRNYTNYTCIDEPILFIFIL